MKPTVGRIVHYTRPEYGRPPSTYAAIITSVDAARGTVLTLCVFLDTATRKGHAKTLYVSGTPCVPFATTPTEYAWSWPPQEGT